MSEPDLNVKFAHFRPPEWVSHEDRGLPEPGDLFYYSRTFGWGDAELQDWLRGIDPYPRGGATICQIESEDGSVGATAVAVCSYSDNFSFARGRHIAYERALDRLNGENTGPHDHNGDDYVGERYVQYLLDRKRDYMKKVQENDNE